MLVCRLWKDIAIHHAPLWLWSVIIPDGDHRLAQQIERMEIQLGRSATLPLVIWFDFISALPSRIDRERIAHILQPHLARVHSISIRVGIASSGTVASLFPRGVEFPALRRLRIRGERDIGLYLDELPGASGTRPPLEYLRLEKLRDNFWIPIIEGCEPKHLVQLDTLSSDLEVSSLHTFLSQCANLRALQVRFNYRVQGSITFDGPPLTLHKLEFLETSIPGGRFPTSHVISEAPNVTHFCIRGQWTDPVTWPMMPSLRIFSFRPKARPPTIDGIPSQVQDFRLHGSFESWRKVLQQLIEGGNVILPWLSHILFYYDDDDNPAQPVCGVPENAEALFRSVLERWPSARFRIIIESWVKKQTPEYLNLVGVSSGGWQGLISDFGYRFDVREDWPQDIHWEFFSF